MDIAALATASSLSNVQDQASVLIMRKAMDVATQNGQALLGLLDTIPKMSPPHLGQAVDISA